MSGFVCDMHACEEYGHIREQRRYPWPSCAGCGLPLYELPGEHRLSRAHWTIIQQGVRAVAAERGLGIGETCRLLGVNGNMLNPKYRRTPKLEVVLGWCQILDVPPDDLLTYSPAMQVSE